VNVGSGLMVDDSSVLYTVLPFFHTNALNTISQALVHGATLAFGKRFSASRFWDEVREVDATQTYLLGAMVGILLKQPESEDDRRHRVRRVLAPATPPEAFEVFERRFGARIVQGFGSTETNSVMSNQLGPYKPGAMGWVRPGYEARVVDADDVQVPAGQVGELVLRHSEPYSFSTGYWRLPNATVEAWRNLWFHTGDRVLRDEDGVFWFKDRVTDSIRRRGENISSYEVESVLETHDGVACAAVVPVPAELGEEEVLAFVVLRDGAAADPLELTRFLEPRLAYFAIPRYFEFVDELPRTEVGRVRKYVLRERGLSPTTWDREAAGYELRR
jgi:crotonobetaine/carnitine-CoA ligase